MEHTAASPDENTLLVRSMAAKVLCSDASWKVCDIALQLHGGSGYIEETGAAMLLRDTRVTRIFEGANEIQAHVVARRLLES